MKRKLLNLGLLILNTGTNHSFQPIRHESKFEIQELRFYSNILCSFSNQHFHPERNNCMITKLIFCMLLTIVFVSCGISKYEKIKVEGIAENAKAGAVVSTDDGKCYYISDKESWGYRYGERIKVRGRLEVVEYPKKGSDSILVAQILRKSIIHYPIIRVLWWSDDYLILPEF